MRRIEITYAPSDVDADGIALSQTPGGAGDLTLNGALASGGVATMGDQQKVTITSASNISNRELTVYGTTKTGNSIQETLTGPNSDEVATNLDFYTVTRVAINGAAAGALTVGVSGNGGSQPIPVNPNLTMFQVGCAVIVDSGTPTWDLQYTYDDVFASSYPTDTHTWFEHQVLNDQTVSADGAIDNPVTAVRVEITTASAGTSLRLVVLQSGE